MTDFVLSLHVVMASVAFGVALGYSLAHRFWLGGVIAGAAVLNEYLQIVLGADGVALLTRAPLTIVFAYFIVHAADRRGLLSEQ